jgi:predicted 2-oxoglutarate/Fe(II)-dependent dioxygenase YbiX
MGNEPTPPPFRMFATTSGLLTVSEMDSLIADNAPSVTHGRLGSGHEDEEIRRSRIVFLHIEERNEWLFRRVWEAAQEFNRQFLGADVTGIENNIQLARYDSDDRGFYNWHTDFAQVAPNRKISISVQLSQPEDYEGGDLELFFGKEPYKTERARGTLIAFPSFVLHRVTPVTRGTRWSLVAWISGDRWR